MATIVEGINKLITASGGTPTGNGGTIAEKLDQLKDVTGGGGGSDLPDVTAEDNGDVPTVVNGAWDKAAPASGDIGVLPLAFDEENNIIQRVSVLKYYCPMDSAT